MSDFPPHIRPRERILNEGVGVLSDTELLAVILRSGKKGRNVIRLAEELLKNNNGDLREIYNKNCLELKRMGIGFVQSVTLLAALELGNRMHASFRETKKLDDFIFVLKKKLSVLSNEVFYVLLLDLRNRVIGKPFCIRSGSKYTILVEPREIVGLALKENAPKMVLLHNHPSGDCSPSPQDILLTKQITEGCVWMNIQLYDHIIVSDKNSFSMRENGFFD